MKLKHKTKWVVILGMALVALGVVTQWQSRQTSFDSSRWRSASFISQTRNRMVQDLIEGRVLIGKSRTQVIALLGPATDTSKFADWDLVYVMGPQDAYIDNEWLVLRTDQRGLIIEQKVVYD